MKKILMQCVLMLFAFTANAAEVTYTVEDLAKLKYRLIIETKQVKVHYYTPDMRSFSCVLSSLNDAVLFLEWVAGLAQKAPKSLVTTEPRKKICVIEFSDEYLEEAGADDKKEDDK